MSSAQLMFVGNYSGQTPEDFFLATNAEQQTITSSLAFVYTAIQSDNTTRTYELGSWAYGPDEVLIARW